MEHSSPPCSELFITLIYLPQNFWAPTWSTTVGTRDMAVKIVKNPSPDENFILVGERDNKQDKYDM